MRSSWDKVPIGDAMRFAKACGVDLLRPRKSRFYLMRIWMRGPKGIRHLSKGIGLQYVIRQLRKLERSNSESSTMAAVGNAGTGSNRGGQVRKASQKTTGQGQP